MGKITDKEFLRQGIEWGISAENQAFMQLAMGAMQQIQGLPVKTVLDYGAGVGAYAESARKLGYDVFAYDIWESCRGYMKQYFPELKQCDEPITTDLLVMIEVAEHMTDIEVHNLFSQIQPTFILFSGCNTSTVNDEYWGHVNIKQPEEWHEFLKRYGYQVREKVPTPTDHTFIYELKQC